MATIRQKLAFNQLVGNGGNVTKAMLSKNPETNKTIYAPATANTPSKLTNSEGFKELCDEVGLTDNFLTKALYDDIKAKKKNRKPELELAFKVKGRLKEHEEKPKGNTYNIFIAEQRGRIARRVLARDTGSEGTSSGLPDSNESKV